MSSKDTKQTGVATTAAAAVVAVVSSVDEPFVDDVDSLSDETSDDLISTTLVERRKRLHDLANEINQWEDDFAQSPTVAAKNSCHIPNAPPAMPFDLLNRSTQTSANNYCSPKQYINSQLLIKSPSPYTYTNTSNTNNNNNNKENKENMVSPMLTGSSVKQTSASSISSKQQTPVAIITPSSSEILNVAQRIMAKRQSNSASSALTSNGTNNVNNNNNNSSNVGSATSCVGQTASESVVRNIKSKFETIIATGSTPSVSDTQQQQQQMTPKLIIKKFEQMSREGNLPLNGATMSSAVLSHQQSSSSTHSMVVGGSGGATPPAPHVVKQASFKARQAAAALASASATSSSSSDNQQHSVAPSSFTNHAEFSSITNSASAVRGPAPLPVQFKEPRSRFNESTINTDHIQPKSIIEKFELLLKSNEQMSCAGAGNEAHALFGSKKTSINDSSSSVGNSAAHCVTISASSSYVGAASLTYVSSIVSPASSLPGGHNQQSNQREDEAIYEELGIEPTRNNAHLMQSTNGDNSDEDDDDDDDDDGDDDEENEKSPKRNRANAAAPPRFGRDDDRDTTSLFEDSSARSSMNARGDNTHDGDYRRRRSFLRDHNATTDGDDDSCAMQSEILSRDERTGCRISGSSYTGSLIDADEFEDEDEADDSVDRRHRRRQQQQQRANNYTDGEATDDYVYNEGETCYNEDECGDEEDDYAPASEAATVSHDETSTLTSSTATSAAAAVSAAAACKQRASMLGGAVERSLPPIDQRSEQHPNYHHHHQQQQQQQQDTNRSRADDNVDVDVIPPLFSIKEYRKQKRRQVNGGRRSSILPQRQTNLSMSNMTTTSSLPPLPVSHYPAGAAAISSVTKNVAGKAAAIPIIPIDPHAEEATKRSKILERIKELDEFIKQEDNIIYQTGVAFERCINDAQFTGSNEHIECNRLLLIACQKRQAFVTEISRLKGVLSAVSTQSASSSNGVKKQRSSSGLVRHDQDSNDLTPSDLTGLLIFSDIQLPIKESYINKLRSGDEKRVFYFLCLIRNGVQVLQTQLISSQELIATRETSITFPNRMAINNVDFGFKVKIDVYILEIVPKDVKTSKQTSIASHATSKFFSPFKNNLFGHHHHASSSTSSNNNNNSNSNNNNNNNQSNSLKIGVGQGGATQNASKGSRLNTTSKYLNHHYNEQNNLGVSNGGAKTSNFIHVDTIEITCKDILNNKFKLNISSSSIPLTGLLYVNVRCTPSKSIELKGFMTLFEDVNGLGSWDRRWCFLNNYNISYWKYPEDEYRIGALGMINLTKCVNERVSILPRDICARKYTIELTICESTSETAASSDEHATKGHIGVNKMKRFRISADTKEQAADWLTNINFALANLRLWNPKNAKLLGAGKH